MDPNALILTVITLWIVEAFRASAWAFVFVLAGYALVRLSLSAVSRFLERL